jgi:hypothetical protein
MRVRDEDAVIGDYVRQVMADTPTPESIAAAKAQQRADRAMVLQQTGLLLDEHGHVIDPGRLIAEAITRAVYGVQP